MRLNEAKIPILVYHDLTESQLRDKVNEKDFYAVKLEEFKKQLEYLKTRDYEPISLDEFIDFKKCIAGLPKKPIILTFDDGNISNYSRAYPLLRHFGFKAIFFVTSGQIGFNGFMSWPELKEICNDVITIGSHGLTHKPLTKLNRDEIKKELMDSKNTIEDKLNVPVKYLSIPGGFYNNRIKRIAIDAGYDVICTSYFGVNYLSNTDLFSLRRIAITYETKIKQFARLLNPPIS